MLKTIFYTGIFGVAYMIFTMSLIYTVGEDIIAQLNYGLIIGVLIWMGTKITDKFD